VDAELGDVATLVADAGAKDKGDQLAGAAFDHYMRDLRRKYATAGVANDVVKKSLRAVMGTVLVVDDAVGVAAVGLRDEPAGGGQVVFAPGAELQAGSQIGCRVGPESLELLDKEEPAEDLETGRAEEVGVLARGVEQKLRLDAVDVWRVEQRLK
jgi:hypothetical protein